MKISELELAHRGGSHMDLWMEFDEIRKMLTELRNPSTTKADSGPTKNELFC